LSEAAESIRLDPATSSGYVVKGAALSRLGRSDEALKAYLEALHIDPEDTDAQEYLGREYLKSMDYDIAERVYRKMITLKPGRAESWYGLGMSLGMEGKGADSVAAYQRALELKPDYIEALNNLAWTRAASADPALRDGAEAVRLAEKACALDKRRRPQLLGTLAAACAEAGNFDLAVATAQEAIDKAHQANDAGLATKNRELQALYKGGKPYHEPAAK
jgi:cytochrome c-type biogenesis protein CcmH/NrfG